MIFIPQELTEFTYDNIQSTVLEWDETTTYAVGDLARIGGWRYKSVINDNLNKPPLSNLATYWYDKWEVANDYAMIDLFSDTKTEWTADGIVEFRRGSKDGIGIGNFNATTITIEYLEALSGVVSGLTIATSVDLNSTITAGIIYVNEVRYDFTATAKLFTASKDTYVDIDLDGNPAYIEVPNLDPAPAIPTNYQRIAKVVTDVDNITDVTDLRTIIDPVLATDTYTFSRNGNVWDAWTYGYGGFTDDTTETIYQPLQRLGTYIRVTFSSGGGNTYCGFLISGLQNDMGNTLNKVNFPDKRIGSQTVSVADFRTEVPKNELMRRIATAKAQLKEAMLFVIDESENTSHNNMIILGNIVKVDGTGENLDINYITWRIAQNIIQ